MFFEMKSLFCIFSVFLLVNSNAVQNYEEFGMVLDDCGKWHVVNSGDNVERDDFNPSTDVFFLLFTRNNPSNYQTLTINDPESIQNSNFNASHPTRFYIHGWLSYGASDQNSVVWNAYLERGDFNVIMVDWSRGGQTPWYSTARDRVAGVGAFVAEFIRFFNSVTGVNPLDLAVIGHSLGAHVAGFTGKNIGEGSRIGVISALDPAHPGFHEHRTDERVHYTDAEYVESVHTNAGLIGIPFPVGHASFYPNYGRAQPGCGVDSSGGCSHNIVVPFFAESITTDLHFYARRCRDFEDINGGNCVESGQSHRMSGEPIDVTAQGVFWLPTNPQYPFAMGPV